SNGVDERGPACSLFALLSAALLPPSCRTLSERRGFRHRNERESSQPPFAPDEVRHETLPRWGCRQSDGPILRQRLRGFRTVRAALAVSRGAERCDDQTLPRKR